MRKLFTQSFAMLLLCPLAAMAQTEKIDAGMMQRIRDEGLQHSHVMDIAFHLTDASGPRLTNSPGFFRAANYAKETLASWGLSDAKLDPWGEFGKGWEIEKSYVAITAPYYKTLTAYPKAWCKGTGGLQKAEVIVVALKDSTSLDAYRGHLKDKIIVMDNSYVYKQSFKADASRYTDEELAKMADALPPGPPDTAAARRRREQFQRGGGAGGGAQRAAALLKEMATAEGAFGMLSSTIRMHDGTLYVQGGGGYKGTDPENFLDIVVGVEDYNTILRLAKGGTTVKMDVDVKTKFYNKDLQGYNVIADFPGTDPALKDEVVMIGAHLDSWHSGTGATDNAAGCTVMMEAIRILKTLGIQPRRTIRIGLWSGEEEGILGSRGYVKKTFADPANMQLLPEHSKLAGYFNIDNGTGKVRGIYLQGNEACRSIFTQWLAPFNDLGAKTVTISTTGGTDHLSFDAVGLPGFQFIQEPMEYDTRTHHSNMDVYDHLSEDDLKQIATIVAGFVYDAAQRDTKLPRKPLPEPRPAGGRGF